MATYLEKLRDPRWIERANQIKLRDENRCRDCGRADQTLNVHHDYYETGHEPWDYPDSALLTLCRDCHEARHQLEKEFARWRSLAWLSLAQIVGELAVRPNFLDGFDPELVAEFDRICALALRKYGESVPA